MKIAENLGVLVKVTVWDILRCATVIATIPNSEENCIKFGIYIYINFSPTWIDIPPGKFGRKFGKAPTDAPTCSKPPVDADVYWGSRPLDKRFWSNGQMLKVTRLSTEKNGVHMSDGGFSAVILFGVFFFKIEI